MRYVPLDEVTARGLPTLSGWVVANGSVTREFRLGSFAAIADFVRDVITSSDRLDHHPDLDIRYPDRVTVRLTTHAIGGLSTLDADLAAEIDGIARRTSLSR